jgi:hypothetical protein
VFVWKRDIESDTQQLRRKGGEGRETHREIIHAQHICAAKSVLSGTATLSKHIVARDRGLGGGGCRGLGTVTDSDIHTYFQIHKR